MRRVVSLAGLAWICITVKVIGRFYRHNHLHCHIQGGGFVEIIYTSRRFCNTTVHSLPFELSDHQSTIVSSSCLISKYCLIKHMMTLLEVVTTLLVIKKDRQRDLISQIQTMKYIFRLGFIKRTYID